MATCGQGVVAKLAWIVVAASRNASSRLVKTDALLVNNW
jgi:hypothetical protein